MTAIIYIQATLAPIHLPRALDPARRTAGWDQLATDALAAAHGNDAAFLASEEYATAALLAWWSPGGAGAGALPVIAAAPRWPLFALTAPTETRPGLLLLNARRKEPPDPAAWQSAEPVGTIQRGPGHDTFHLFRVVPRPGAAAAILPAR